MKRLLIPALALVVIATGVAMGAEGPKYDPATETTMKGAMVYAGEFASAAGKGFYVIMKESPNEIEVYLAPGDFVRSSGLHLETGEMVEIIGSKVKCTGTEAVLARSITHDGKTLQLRNEKGEPLW